MSRKLQTISFLFLLFAGVHFLPARSAAQGSAGIPRPVFEGDEAVQSREGHATIRWRIDPLKEGAEFELQQAGSSEFEDPLVRYEGRDLAVFVSGLPEGSTYFRVRTLDAGGQPGPWSERLEIQVDYPSRGMVIGLLTVGGFVFVTTVAAVVFGHRSAYPRTKAA